MQCPHGRHVSEATAVGGGDGAGPSAGRVAPVSRRRSGLPRAAHGSRRTGSAGTQGPRVSAVARQRIPRGPDGLAERRARAQTEPGGAAALGLLPAPCPGADALADLWRVPWAALGGGPRLRRRATGGGQGPVCGAAIAGVAPQRLPPMLAPCWRWHLQSRWGPTSSSPPRGAAPERAGGPLAPAPVAHGGGPRWRSLGPTASSRRVSCAPKVAGD